MTARAEGSPKDRSRAKRQEADTRPVRKGKAFEEAVQ
jgi:hypothetical protein